MYSPLKNNVSKQGDSVTCGGVRPLAKVGDNKKAGSESVRYKGYIIVWSNSKEMQTREGVNPPPNNERSKPNDQRHDRLYSHSIVVDTNRTTGELSPRPTYNTGIKHTYKGRTVFTAHPFQPEQSPAGIKRNRGDITLGTVYHPDRLPEDARGMG